MDFTLGAADSEVRANAVTLAREVAPFANAWDEGTTLRREANELLARHGLLALLVETDSGGPPRALPLVLVREELAAVSSHVDSLFAVQGLASQPIRLAGDDRQRNRYLPEVAAGRLIGGFAL